MNSSPDFGQLNADLIIEFNRRLIQGLDDDQVPHDAVVIFIPDDPDHRLYNIEIGLQLIDEGYDVFFKRVIPAQDLSRNEPEITNVG